MRDRIFYPLFLLVVGGIIAISLLPGRGQAGPSQADILTQGYTLSGEDLRKLTPSPGTLVNYPEGSDFAVLSANLPQKMASASAGVFGTLSPRYEQAFAGQTIKATLVARSHKDAPLENFLMAYFTAGAGDSGWRNYALTPNFKEYSFTFTVKEQAAAGGNDYFGIWPGVDGKSLAMDVKSMRIDVITP